MATRRELIQAITGRYHDAARHDKKKILDEFIKVTGFHRKHAIRTLRRSAVTEAPNPAAPRSRLYDEAVVQALTILWEAADRICGKRLKSAIPTLLDATERHGHLQPSPEIRRLILTASAATIDSAWPRPSGSVSKAVGERESTRRSGRALRYVRSQTGTIQLPVSSRWTWWHIAANRSPGSHVHSLVLTDIASAWTVAAAMVVREQTLVKVTVENICRQLPFPLLGLDVDNDGAFINETLVNYCKDQGIVLTRSRAYKKNDQAWIEQKNGSVVRRMVGYGRLEGNAAVAGLAELHEAARLYVNFFLPSFKLMSKSRDGAKVSKKYDKPATSFQRLSADGRITEEQKKSLRETFARLDPILLLNRIRESQQRIAGIEVRGGPVEPVDLNQNLDIFVSNLGIAWKAGEVRSAHRKPNTYPRHWRTRADPFETIWPLIESWLNERPDANARELFQHLQASGLEVQPGQLRTLQRRVKTWRTEIARRLVLGCDSAIITTEGKKGRGHPIVGALPQAPGFNAFLAGMDAEGATHWATPFMPARESRSGFHPWIALSSNSSSPSLRTPPWNIQ